MDEKLFVYEKGLEAEWNKGQLKRKWCNEYPELFSEEEYGIAEFKVVISVSA
jgi:hypothetical protein